MEVEDRLTRPWPDIDDHTVVVQPGDRRRLGDEIEHAARFVGRKHPDFPKRRDVTLGQDEHVHRRLGRGILDRKEARSAVHDRRRKLAGHDPAEHTRLVRQR